MKGIMTFYMNVEECEDIKAYLDILIDINSGLIQRMEEAGYGVMVVPVRNESSRVEKVDFDQPFPRFILPHVDIVEHDKIIQEIKEKAGKEAECE